METPKPDKRLARIIPNSRKKGGGAYCAFLGVGFGKTTRKGNTAYCFILGGSDGPIGGESE